MSRRLPCLDVIAFVEAIPVTLIYRIVEGAYPGDQLSSAAGLDSMPGAAQLVWQRVEGIGATANTVLYGLFSATSDAVAISGGLACGKSPFRKNIKILLSTHLGLR